MPEIEIFRMRPGRMETAIFSRIAENLGIKGKAVETEDALAISTPTQALAYAQPGSKMGGLLLYTDQSRGYSERVEKLQDVKSARAWAAAFLEKFGLMPKIDAKEGIKQEIRIFGYQLNSFHFDGKRRQKIKLKTDVASKVAINNIPVVGPRAKIRMIFKDKVAPVAIHRALWEKIEAYEKRELIAKKDVVEAIERKLKDRSSKVKNQEVADVRLAYFAQEYSGGPDLLMPYYFIELEEKTRKMELLGISQGIKHVIWVPAFR
jgi:regulatory protein YycI of two-component signal transduction system YycFG